MKSGTSVRVPLIRQRPVCHDSAHTSTSTFTDARTSAFASSYSSQSTTITRRNKILFTISSFYTAPNDAPLIWALGIAGSTTGINIGARCHKLYVDFSKPVVLIPLRTLKNSTTAYSGSLSLLVPFSPLLGGLKVGVQGAWSDSKTKAFSLTAAQHVTLPASLPPETGPLRKASFGYSVTATLANFSPSTFYLYSPFCRYKKK